MSRERIRYMGDKIVVEKYIFGIKVSEKHIHEVKKK